ncbi:MAG: RNA polymerase sigma factor [Oscillospiraceae bacterium]
MKDINKLVEKIKNGNKKAFDDMYTLTSSELYWYCRRICGNDGDAKDLLQSTYLKVWKKIDSYTDISFTAWLHSIAHNLWLDTLKKKKEDLFSEDEFEKIPEDELLKPDNQTEQRIRHDEIMKLIDETLNDVQRMTILMYYYDEKSISEIAGEMDCTECTVRVRLYRAKEKLGHKIKDKDLFSISFPLMFKASAQKPELSDTLKIMQKSISHKITLSSVKLPCVIATISTGAVIAGVTISEIGLPTERIKGVDNNEIVNYNTSVSFSQTEIYQETYEESESTITEISDNTANCDTIDTAYSADYSNIPQNISTYEFAVNTEVSTELTESESTVDALASYYADYERFMSEVVEMCESEEINDEEVKELIPTFSEIYVKYNPVPRENVTENTISVSDTEKCSE